VSKAGSISSRSQNDRIPQEFCQFSKRCWLSGQTNLGIITVFTYIRVGIYFKAGVGAERHTATLRVEKDGN
jgi:hypothetical protein